MKLDLGSKIAVLTIAFVVFSIILASVLEGRKEYRKWRKQPIPSLYTFLHSAAAFKPLCVLTFIIGTILLFHGIEMIRFLHITQTESIHLRISIIEHIWLNKTMSFLIRGLALICYFVWTYATGTYLYGIRPKSKNKRLKYISSRKPLTA